MLSAAEMRQLDEATMRGHSSGAALMERAGAGVVEAMERRYGPVLGLRVLVLCGTGNNGGDGLVAARRLRERGALVTVGVVGDPARIAGDARAPLERLIESGGTAGALDGEPALAALLGSRDHWDFALDAVLGTGARGVPEGLAAAAVQALRELDDAGTRVVAVDLPTGVAADRGSIARRAVRADLTVTFGHPKRGHLLYPGRAFAGALEIVDIGLIDATPAPERFPFELATAAAMAALMPERDPRAHKGVTGRVLIVGGSAGLSGAVALAARAATRSGAGYVQLAVPASLHDPLAAKLTEEMTIPCPETGARALALDALEPIQKRAAAADVVVIGSGLSRTPEAAELARRLIAGCDRPQLIDADGLNALADATAPLGPGGPPRVLTPHLGEAARLTGLDTAALERARFDAAREWAGRLSSVLVLKGAPTVIGSPGGIATVNPTGNAGMASAGMGDALSGTIAALIGQGLEAYDAARLGAWAHGAAGDLAAAELGSTGFSAGDLIERLPRAFERLRREGEWLAAGNDARGPRATREPRS